MSSIRDNSLCMPASRKPLKTRRTPRRWPGQTADAIKRQQDLAPRIEQADRFGPVRLVGGADVAFEANGDITRAAMVVMTFPTLELVTSAVARMPTEFPYVPGLLSFREVPALMEAHAALDAHPDLLLVDGHGYAHPQRLGIASHLGLELDVPTVGVAKSRLIGEYAEPESGKGASTPLIDDRKGKGAGETIGTVLRTRSNVKPVFVSIGHRISLSTAVDVVMACTPQYRLPEPIRLADRLSKGGAAPIAQFAH